MNDYTIISGTPKTILPKIRHVLEYIRPGSVFFWDGDGAMTHEDQMRSLRLMGEEVIPAVREMGKELELFSPFEVDPATGKPLTTEAGAPQPATGQHYDLTVRMRRRREEGCKTLVAKCCTSRNQATALDKSATLEGGVILPGFSLPLTASSSRLSSVDARRLKDLLYGFCRR